MSKKKRNLFADAIISICIIMATVISIYTLVEYHRLETPITYDVLTVLFSFYGGELLIIAARQIFGSDVVKRKEEI